MNLKGFGRVKYPSKPLIFNSPKLGEFGGGGEEICSIFIFFLNCQFCLYDVHIYIKLANDGYNYQFI